jgi:hypothetical protein
MHTSPGMIAAFGQHRCDPIFLPHVAFAQKLDLDPVLRRQSLGISAQRVPKRLGELGIVEDPDLPLVQIRSHVLGKADLRQRAAKLQAAADRLSPEIIRKRLDYWTFLLGPQFCAKERKQMNLSRFYAIAQIEYCRNFIFKRNFPIHKIFEHACELGLWRLTAHRISKSSACG